MPLAAQSRDEPEPYSLPDSTTSGVPASTVVLRGLVDSWSSASPSGGEVAGDAALGARGQLVAQPDVGEGAADHDLVVAAARAVGVEVALLDPVLTRGTDPAGESFLIAPAGEMWSVVTESPSFSSTRAPSMSSTGSGSSRHAVEVRRACGRRSSPRPRRRCRRRASRSDLPPLVAGEDVGVVVGEHVRGDRRGDDLLDLGRARARCPSGRRRCRRCPGPAGR